VIDLAKEFDDNRAHLRAVAVRMLGSEAEADDAVQEAWIKLSRADAAAIHNLGGWLTTVVARVCLDMLRSRKSRHEEALADITSLHTPESDVALADAIGPAVLVMLQQLAPAERVAFVLHDMFDLSFDEIAPIVERSPVAARQLASRARRRVRGGSANPEDVARHREVVNAFLSAWRDNNLEKLLSVLAPDAVMRADELAVKTAAANKGAPEIVLEANGAERVASVFRGRAVGTMLATIGGEPGIAWGAKNQVRSAFVFTVEDGVITAIDLVMDPATLGDLDVVVD
jgi:RNA polymerase sigma-70 factor (ECF subfamily)